MCMNKSHKIRIKAEKAKRKNIEKENFLGHKT